MNEMKVTKLISKLEKMGIKREDIISEIDTTLDKLNIERKALSQETITDELANDIIYGFIVESEMN